MFEDKSDEAYKKLLLILGGDKACADVDESICIPAMLIRC